MESQVPDGAARITRTYTYYSYVPGHTVNGATLDTSGWGSGNADSLWASPNQATPNGEDTEDSGTVEKEGSDAERYV